MIRLFACCALVGGALAAVAVPDHPAPATSPSPGAVETPPRPETEADHADDRPTAPPAPAPHRPRRVWIFIDRYKETGGTVEAEDETSIVIRDRNGDLSSFSKGRLVGVVPLVDVPEGGHDGVIHRRDGSHLRALIHEDAFDFVDYEIAGIRNRMPRDAVVQVTLEPSFEERYARFKEAIKPNEIDKRLTFARWLVAEKRYGLAAEELRALTREIDLPEGRELLRQVEAHLAMERATAARRGEPDASDRSRTGARAQPEPRRSGPVHLREVLPSRLVSPDDVNIIRVYEIDLAKPPRVEIPPDVIRDLLTRYGSSSLVPAGGEERNRMFSWDSTRLMKLIFDLKARDLYPRVRVASEPWTLNLFRTKVHDAWLIPNCSTSQCHGGIDAGRFFLHRRNSKDERVRYTNLLILLRLKLDQPLVNFEDPESSLIVQYAMPRDEARYPHPDVKGWKPVFTGSARQLKAETLRWIRGMYKPRPEYPVDYEPPMLEAIEPARDDEEPVER